MFTFIHKYIKIELLVFLEQIRSMVAHAKSATGVSLKFFMNLFVKVELNDTNPTAHKKTSFSKSNGCFMMHVNWH